MKNLLFFASDFSIGLSSLLTDQLIALYNAGVNVTAIAGENEQEAGLADRLRSYNINVTRIEGLDRHQEFNRLVSEIANIVETKKIDIIHVQNNWQLALAAAVKAKFLFKHKLKIIYTLHGFRHNHPVKSQIAKLIIGSSLFAFADYIICMTEYLKRNFRLLSYKIKLLPLGVKNDYFTDPFIEPPTDSLKLIFPGQFRYGKNQDIIIRAFAEFVKQTNETTATLTLPGNGDLLDEMKSLAKNLGIENQVTFPGFVTKDDIKKLYLNSNIGIVASNSETFGQSIVEPFILGRCIVSTPVGIAPEIIKDGMNGFIFKTEKDLIKILLYLNKNLKLLEVIGKNNYKNRNLFNWDEITKKYIDIFL